jgi:pilus assembly protein Flp/PilA
MLTYIKNFLAEEDGPTAVEYAVMLALILAVIAAAISGVGFNTLSMWQDNSNQMTTNGLGS